MTWNPFKRWARRSDDDFSEEVESHLAMEAERLVRGGMSEGDAVHAARRAFGNATAAREHFHESRRWSALESLAQDVRYGLRGLRRMPGITAIAITSLAIGIGANTTMFSAIDALLVRTPAHVQDATRVHRVYFEVPNFGGGMEATASLAAMGLYGLLSYMVAQRTHEIGVRKALGASDAGVIRMVLFGSLGMTLAGVAGGVLIALGAGRLVANQLYGVSPRDPAVMALCVGVLVVVAIVACIAPARRATRVDPMVALRAD